MVRRLGRSGGWFAGPGVCAPRVDQGVEKAGDMADKRTGGRYDDQIDKGVDQAQARTGEGDQVR
ncbi:antitoxin [Micromonospora orduensis]|uniref:Antitoxin n=1 Tax=Micromonospora orduensis TaxID=1420891 RepID=A0A5C4QVL9_9ACTN|nr:antitoxin [Micromonospora orduensis]